MNIRTIVGIAAGCAAVMLLTTTPCVADPCELPDAGGGVVLLPPEGCEYMSSSDLHELIQGLPDDTDFIVRPIHSAFWDIVRAPGSPLAPLGETETFNSTLILDMIGTGDLEGVNSTLTCEVACEVYTEEHHPNKPFGTEMYRLEGGCDADANFASLQIEAGAHFGLTPSVGITQFKAGTGGNIRVKSSFDIYYQFTFEGADGGPLEGMSGTTQGSAKMEIPDAGIPAVSTWGVAVMVLLILAAGTVVIRRSRGLDAAA